MTRERVDLSKPIWDLNTFSGRLRYFSWITNPMLVFNSKESLHNAKTLVEQYKAGKEPPGTSRETILRAQQLCLSAFHPDSGELQNMMGRMSFQVPGGMVLIGAMVTFYKSNVAVVFWQWANQSFNALVNYTNRNAASDITTKQIGFAYATATTSALVTALGLKAYLAKVASPFLQRFVPFAAVCAANMVNIPLMRQSELIDGIVVRDENDNEVTQSKYAAIKGISQVVFSRIVMCSPSMVLLPVLMEKIEKRPFLLKYGKFVNAPMQVFLSGLSFCLLVVMLRMTYILCSSDFGLLHNFGLLCSDEVSQGFSLLVMVPIGCALFNQRCSIATEKLKILDKDRYEEVKAKYGDNLPQTLYFNKGL